jgi:hypothetical protein
VTVPEAYAGCMRARVAVCMVLPYAVALAVMALAG